MRITALRAPRGLSGSAWAAGLWVLGDRGHPHDEADGMAIERLADVDVHAIEADVDRGMSATAALIEKSLPGDDAIAPIPPPQQDHEASIDRIDVRGFEPRADWYRRRGPVLGAVARERLQHQGRWVRPPCPDPAQRSEPEDCVPSIARTEHADSTTHAHRADDFTAAEYHPLWSLHALVPT
ncbi:MAG: hypothetical protein JRI68_17670 [Deltaproteobacteria bacterium]|nr:hypothetical protein [Deltaproteobacteria bacterium]